MAESAEVERFVNFTSTKVSSFLREKCPEVSESVLESISDHKIDGDAFLQLDYQGLKEIAPLLGDRLKIKRVMKSILDEMTPVTVSWCSTCISYE